MLARFLSSKRLALHLIGGLALCLMPACATVDVSGIASPQMTEAAEPEAVNPVLTASETLMARFTENGWSQKANQQKPSAFKIFGWTGTQKDEAAAKPLKASAQDIQEAANLVSALASAAQTHLQSADIAARPEPELTALEEALTVVQSTKFAAPSPQHAVQIAALTEAESRLSRAANAYGDRVRAAIAAAAQKPQG